MAKDVGATGEGGEVDEDDADEEDDDDNDDDEKEVDTDDDDICSWRFLTTYLSRRWSSPRRSKISWAGMRRGANLSSSSSSSVMGAETEPSGSSSIKSLRCCMW